MFNLEEFDIKLKTEWLGRNFIYTEEIESTNSYLLNKQNKIDKNGTILLAEKQVNGRGRKDRVWVSAKGLNLTFSLLITNKKILNEHMNYFNFVSSLSVANAIENLYQIRTELKWPNDILLNRKKTAGILIESSSAGNNINRAVIGIGLNVNQITFPGNYLIEPTSIKVEMHDNVERERLLAEILNIMEEQFDNLMVSPKAIMDNWRERCRMIGEQVSIIEGENAKYGVFEDIDDEGFLILRTREGKEKIYYGDVSLR